MNEKALNEVTQKIIAGAYAVANTLGAGFLEKVYENALAHERHCAGLNAEQQKPVEVKYRGIAVGQYLADLLVNEAVIVEIKAVKSLDEIHLAQCLNYLKATALKVGLLINFGAPRIQIKRVVNNL